MPKPRDPNLKQRVFDLRASNRPMDWIAEHLGVPEPTLYGWCREHRVLARADLRAVVADMEVLSDARNIPELWDLAARLKKAVRGMCV